MEVTECNPLGAPSAQLAELPRWSNPGRQCPTPGCRGLGFVWTRPEAVPIFAPYPGAPTQESVCYKRCATCNALYERRVIDLTRL